MQLRDKYGHQLSHKAFDLQSVLPDRCAGAMVVGGSELMGVVNQCSNLTYSSLQESEPMLVTA